MRRAVSGYRCVRTTSPESRGYFRFASLILAFVFMSAPMSGASDILGLLENKDARAKEAVSRPTISRVSELPRLPVSSRQYEFLIDHPHLSMVLARICDPSLDSYKVEVKPAGVIHVDDPAGLAGDMVLINSIPGRRIYFVSGHFDILKMRFKGHVVLLMLYSERAGRAGMSVDSTTTSYIKVNSAFAGFFTKIAAFLFPKRVDERIGRFANAVSRVAVTVHDDPAVAYRKLATSGQISPQELKEFAGMFLRKALTAEK